MFEMLKALFRKKNLLAVGFHDSAGEFFVKKVKYRGNTFKVRINGEMQEYVVDPKRTKWSRHLHRPYAEYYVGNPEPITFLHSRNPELDSVSLHRIMEDKSITDLFSNDSIKRLTLIIVLLIVVIGLILVLMAFQTGVIDVGGNVTAGA